MVMMVIIAWWAFVGGLGALDNDERFRVWWIFNSLDDIGDDHDGEDDGDDDGEMMAMMMAVQIGFVFGEPSTRVSG